MQSHSTFSLSVLLSVLALAGCSKLSNVGELTQPSTVAVAATIGQPYTTDSSGVLHTTVRAGSDVELTGVDSENGTSDTGDPIIYFDWQQINPGATAVDLIPRASNTVGFTAPQVTAPTTLTFKLTVSAANGATASTQAQVVVEPVRDTDHFLTFLGTADEFTITAATSAVVAGDAQAAYGATIPYTITVTKLISYTDINGIQHTQVPIGQPVTFSGGWSSQLGSGGGACGDPRNPEIQVAIPKLNLDDAFPDGSGHLSDLLETSDVDRDPANSNLPPNVSSIERAVVYAQVQITATGLPAGVNAQVCIGPPGTATAAASPAPVDADSLTAAANSSSALYDSSASAHTYYQTIDPAGTRTTLVQWLGANGFNPAVSGWGADAHAVYTNNYDLGLGRDMYLKVGSCDSGYNAAPLSQFAASSLAAPTAQALTQLIGHCDVAAVVVNYVGVQAAAEHLNEIVAVAMEYSAAPGTGARYTKFYVFAPDTRTGALQRVTSVDLDHRGQKYVPQSCVVCHGGTPASPGQLAQTAPYYSSTAPSGIYGDVNAGFLPWDLTSFWYSDTDPGFSQKSEDAALKAQYTEANQVGQFKLLNVGAYLTTADPNRYALERELLEGWYGGPGLPSAYVGNFVPAGWQPTANGNPSTSAMLYTDVFAHSCRACHIMQAPAAGLNLSSGGASGSGSAACTQATSTTHLGLTADQFPIGCYWQFANQTVLAQVVSQARMPFARRTADRLWVDPAGDPAGSTTSAAGQELLTDLTSLYASSSNPPKVVAPGTPDVSIPPFPKSMPGGQQADVLSWLTLGVTDGYFTDGEFVTQPTWQVCVDTGSGSCAGSTQQISVVGSGAIPAGFQIPYSGNFLAELDSAGSKLLTQSLSVPTVAPHINAGALPAQVARQGSLTLVGDNVVTAGNGPLSAHQWWVSALSNLSIASGTPNCVAASPCSVANSSITLAETDPTASSGSYTVNVIDAEGTAAQPVTQAVSISSTLTAATVTGYVGTNTANQTVLSAGAALDLSQGNSLQAGQSFQVQLLCNGVAASSCVAGVNSHGVSGTAAVVSGTHVQYSPPPAYATNPPGGSVAPGVQLSYQLQKFGAGNVLLDQSPPTPFYIQVRARVSWDSDVVGAVFNRTSAYPSGQAECNSSGCHDGNTTDAINFASSSTTDRSTTIYCDLVGCPTPLTPVTDTSRPYVDTSTVLNSVLLRHPAELDTSSPYYPHTGANRCPDGFNSAVNPPTAFLNTDGTNHCDLVNVLEWIEDGANDF